AGVDGPAVPLHGQEMAGLDREGDLVPERLVGGFPAAFVKGQLARPDPVTLRLAAAAIGPEQYFGRLDEAQRGAQREAGEVLRDIVDADNRDVGQMEHQGFVVVCGFVHPAWAAGQSVPLQWAPNENTPSGVVSDCAPAAPAAMSTSQKAVRRRCRMIIG